jgi:hypothetical protein
MRHARVWLPSGTACSVRFPSLRARPSVGLCHATNYLRPGCSDASVGSMGGGSCHIASNARLTLAPHIEAHLRPATVGVPVRHPSVGVVAATLRAPDPPKFTGIHGLDAPRQCARPVT